MKRVVRVGTRGSRLALAQTRLVIRLLAARSRKTVFKIVVIKTKGDRDLSEALFAGPNIGVFTKEIEKALLVNRIDIGIHSLKDLPTTLTRGLAIGAYCKREDPRDCLVTRAGRSVRGLPSGAVIGTSSLRRRCQLSRARPDLRIVGLRGNLTTRLDRVRKGELDGAVVATAGLKRIRAFTARMRPLDPSLMLPCPAQGILAVEIRALDTDTKALAAAANDLHAEREGLAERELLKILEGGCRVPIGALARSRKNGLSLEAVVYSVKNSGFLRASGRAGRSADPLELARRVARQLIRQGAKKFLYEARQS